MTDIKELTGAVSVEADVTPTLRQKIDQVDANGWTKLSSQQLWLQKNTLQTRLVYAHQSNHPEMAIQIQRGIDAIDEILRAKAPENDKNMIY